MLALAAVFAGCSAAQRDHPLDASTGPHDSGGEASDAGHDSGPDHDASGRSDASGSSLDADGPSDAAPEAGPEPGDRCGEAAAYPFPLPALEARTASPVGSESFRFIEGPVWLADQGVLLFSDMDFSSDDSQGPLSRIIRLHPPASFEVWVESSGSNGLALAPSGDVLAATHDNQGLSVFDKSSQARATLSVKTSGKRLNSPNDLTVRKDGVVYLTDPDWQLGRRNSETGVTGVYRVGPPLREGGDNEAILLDDSLDQPNGIALSPDETTLYVGSSGAKIWKYRVHPDGSISDRAEFADTGASDGMTVDCAGNVYVTSGTVEVFSPSGEALGEIKVPKGPTNVAFGGSDRKTLYITADDTLYWIKLNVPGYPY